MKKLRSRLLIFAKSSGGGGVEEEVNREALGKPGACSIHNSFMTLSSQHLPTLLCLSLHISHLIKLLSRKLTPERGFDSQLIMIKR